MLTFRIFVLTYFYMYTVAATYRIPLVFIRIYLFYFFFIFPAANDPGLLTATERVRAADGRGFIVNAHDRYLKKKNYLVYLVLIRRLTRR